MKIMSKVTLIGFSLSILIIGRTDAQGVRYYYNTLLVPKATTAPTIDGVLDTAAWNVASDHLAAFYPEGIGKIDSIGDVSATFRTMWDENYIYYFISVLDDQLTRDGQGDHEDDGIEIYWDADNSKGSEYDGVNDVQFWWRYKDAGPLGGVADSVGYGTASATGPTDLALETILQAAMPTDAGLDLEVAFPFSLFGVTGQTGYTYGMEVDYNDDDDGGGRDTKLKWYSYADLSWNNPSIMATAKLVGELGVTPPTVLPEHFKLAQNYPNPFNPATKIQYTITETSDVRLIVYNMLGQKTATLVDKIQNPMVYEINFDGSNLASGVYFYKLQVGNNVQMRKMVLLK